MHYIPYGRQDINQTDIDAVLAVLRSDFLTQGPVVATFEEAISDYCDVQHAIAVNSATSALHLACLALGVGKGDVIWTTPITFVASANCALYCGAKVCFIDIDSSTYNISVERLSEKLAEAEKRGKLPKVVIPVHLCGQSCDMEKIHQLSQRYGFRVIEDASHAIGGCYKNKPIGCCEYSDITIFSFHPVKIITTGEGGVATTNDSQLAKRMRLLSISGVTRDPELMTQEPDGSWYYQQVDLGFNYRMTDIQAALGISQMKRLNEFVNKRWALAKSYNKLLADLPLTLPWQHPESYSSFHLYVIRLQLNKIKKTHLEVFNFLRASGIGVNLHYIPIYRQPYYQNKRFNVLAYPEAEKYYAEAISLPMYPKMTNSELMYITKALNKVLLK